MTGEREPALRTDHIDPSKIQIGHRAAPARSRVVKSLAVAAIVTAFCLVTWFVSDAPYSTPYSGSAQHEPELVISFRHPGAVKLGRLLTPEEKARYPAYLKRERVRLRERTPVRLRIHIDGEVVYEDLHRGSGLREDGDSIAIVRLNVPAGRHEVTVFLGDTEDVEEWSHQIASVVRFQPSRRSVLLFDRVKGFRWDAVVER